MSIFRKNHFHSRNQSRLLSDIGYLTPDDPKFSTTFYREVKALYKDIPLYVASVDVQSDNGDDFVRRLRDLAHAEAARLEAVRQKNLYAAGNLPETCETKIKECESGIQMLDDLSQKLDAIVNGRWEE